MRTTGALRLWRRRWVALPCVFICGLLLAACARSSAHGSPDPQTVQLDFSFEGLSRSAVIHLPSIEDSETPMPVVLLFHGGGGTAEGMENISGFDDTADQYNVIAVYPSGYRKSWTDGRGTTPDDQLGVDDIGFISALLDKLEQQYKVDSHRVFAAGLSNGAFFSQRLGCDLSDRIAAIAPIAGTQGVNYAPSCQPGRPVSVLEIHGTEDPLVPYKGGAMRGRGGTSSILSAEEVTNNWASIDGCSESPTTNDIPDQADDGTHLVVWSYQDCNANASVKLYEVEGGGHTWPGGEQYLPSLLVGKTTGQFNASDTIWKFFAAHPMP